MNDPEVSKPYKLIFENRPDYLYVYVEAKHDTYAISLAYWLEVADETKRTKSKCVLIDENIEESASMTEVFQISTEITKMGFGWTRIAFVDRYLDQIEVNQFGQLVLANRGANVKVFNDVESAEKWLLDGK